MSNPLIKIPYEEARLKIQEGDILLFRGSSIASSFIKRFTGGIYSHVGVASWSNGPNNPDPILECVEFREGYGGRAVNFENELRKHNGLIDVYRTTPYYNKLSYNTATNKVDTKLITFNGKAVTKVMRKMTGLPYGWKRIWWMIKQKLIIIRLIYSTKDIYNDELKAVIYPVCSTAMAYAWNTINFDLIPNKSDEWSNPSDISRSGLVSYLFTPILLENNK